MKSIAEAIIANNKKAFPTGKPTSMQAGATLVIPSFESITGMNSNGESSNLVIQKQILMFQLIRIGDGFASLKIQKKTFLC